MKSFLVSLILLGLFGTFSLWGSIAIVHGQEEKEEDAATATTTSETSSASSIVEEELIVEKEEEQLSPQTETQAKTSEEEDDELIIEETVVLKDEEVETPNTVLQDETQQQQQQQESSSTVDETTTAAQEQKEEPIQSGPFVDILGPTLYSLEMIDETTATIKEHLTNDALRGKRVVGLYFSADWCGPCRQFTPELVSFYNKMNSRRGKKDQFEIVWVSRCRDGNAYVQYFTHMNWLALPPELAMGEVGQQLSQKYKVKSIPTLVLLDDLANVITTDARNKIPQDKAGIGFPWRNPISQVVSTIVPRSLRLMVKSKIDTIKAKMMQKVKAMIGLGPKPVAA